MRRRAVQRAQTATAIALAFVVSTCATHGLAFAQSSSSVVAAEALFQQGRQLMNEGKYELACPKFADSQKIDPSSSTLLNLANCYEKLGRTATAWATYREAASWAKKEGHEDYLATALKRADALYPKLSKLTIHVTTPVDGLEIKRDGVVVTPSEWGAAIPADPGMHAIEASAPHKEKWTGSVEVGPDAATATVDVPPLAPSKEAPPPPPPPPPPIEDKTKPTTSSSFSLKTAGWIVGSVGLVGAGIGTIFVVQGKSKYDDSLKDCSPSDKNVCGHTGVSLRDDARAAGNIATALYVFAGVAIATGVVMILASPASTESPRKSASVQLVPTLGGAALMGSF